MATNQTSVKFNLYGIRADGKYIPVSYSKGNRADGNMEIITIYAKSIDHLPECLGKIENGTDILTDYFEEDRVDILPQSPYYQAVLKAWRASQIKEWEARRKYAEERALKHPYQADFYHGEARYATEKLKTLGAI